MTQFHGRFAGEYRRYRRRTPRRQIACDEVVARDVPLGIRPKPRIPQHTAGTMPTTLSPDWFAAAIVLFLR
ncbi:MAG TPA: hypothetical protein VHC19_20750 [Pirellulales bacterium]|nr:hypothetical protein [Pirellulales bacterium]